MKFSRLPLAALLAASAFLAFTPDSLARGTDDFSSILRKIYRNSKDDDAKDIFAIISKEIGQNSSSADNEKLVKKIIKELKKHKDQLANGVSDEDLDRVFKKAKKFIRNHPPEDKGNVKPPESSTQNA